MDSNKSCFSEGESSELIDNKKWYVSKYRKVNGKCLSNFITKAN